MNIVINNNGQINFIYNDDLIFLMEEGKSEIKRASMVEPTNGKWTADMSLCGGPILGPFGTRREALSNEVKWLTEFLMCITD